MCDTVLVYSVFLLSVYACAQNVCRGTLGLKLGSQSYMWFQPHTKFDVLLLIKYVIPATILLCSHKLDYSASFINFGVYSTLSLIFTHDYYVSAFLLCTAVRTPYFRKTDANDRGSNGNNNNSNDRRQHTYVQFIAAHTKRIYTAFTIILILAHIAEYIKALPKRISYTNMYCEISGGYKLGIYW